MSRDIVDRMEVFGCSLEFDRLALNWDQVEQYNPPPNPAKVTDSRAHGYIQEFGSSSWELDALEPRVIADLIPGAILVLRDEDKWKEAEQEETKGTNLLYRVSDEWNTVVENLND